ncbi:MAG: NAD-dependent epimerase/dehydratase family protein [Candidatus Nitricoxidivorans perseverans]|uniref:NAD-dependent epimerase/dehydratase family protein n=1 Tax=Candidatus Nitricoxidivorans perseverans TaxID=2975601 RepID=A0AA49IXK9_9PROT|nr:MAG: NAD-dependent epimerase/dehydratase family protein [Candidatus Nitricoxidivorans perseverans]
MADRQVLISGGLGFIGQALMAPLLADGVRVRVLDDLSNPSIPPEVARGMGAEVIVGNIADKDACFQAAEGVAGIVHLAAQTYVARSIEDPWSDLRINGQGTLNLLEAARRCGVEHFVLASSNAVAGTAQPPFSEEARLNPLSPYGCTKLLAESYCGVYARTHGVRTVALRFSNIFGPGSWRKGSVVATFIRKALQGEPVVVDGDGRQTRDFLYIDDLVAAIRLAMERAPAGEVFCIGAGRATTIAEVVGELDRIYSSWAGKPMMIEHGPPRLGDIRDNWSDISKAGRLLGFSPDRPLGVAMEQTFGWFVEEWLPVSGNWPTH